MEFYSRTIDGTYTQVVTVINGRIAAEETWVQTTGQKLVRLPSLIGQSSQNLKATGFKKAEWKPDDLLDRNV